MKRKVYAAIGLLGVLALASGCAYDATRSGSTSDIGLFFSQTGGVATLAYGRANSDAVGLVLQCRAGSRQIEVSDVARSDKADSLTLISGSVRTQLAATIDTSTGQPTLWAKAAFDAPALKTFRKSGRMAVSTRGGGYSLTARASERAGVESFFRACGRA